MKTAYDLLHRSNPNLGYTDNRGTYDTMLEAAAAIAGLRPGLDADFVTDPAKWACTADGSGWTLADWVCQAADLSFSPWGIFERQVPETDAERIELVLDLLTSYGQDDGAHHKAWVIDQTVRLLAGDGYEQWVTEYRDGEDGPDTYEWDEGVAP